MPKLTPEQEKQRAERAARMKQPTEPIASADAGEPEPVSLTFIIGAPETLRLGDKSYPLDEFPIMSIEDGYSRIYACPAILLSLALASKDGEEVDIEALTSAYNALVDHPNDPDGNPIYFNTDYIRGTVASIPEIMAKPEMRERIVEAVLFALRPTNEGIKVEDLAVPQFTKRWFLEFLRAVYRVNIGMRESF